MEMENNDLQRTEGEILTMISELRSLNLVTGHKVNKLICSNTESSEKEAVRAILIEADKLRKAQEYFDGLRNFPESEEESEDLKAKIKELKTEARDLEKRVDEFEEKFLKYNVPRLHESESWKEYAESLKEFMKIWKEEAKKGREKGEKSLIEWLRLLDQSENQERKTTFKAMRLVVVDLGIQISDHLALPFLLMSASITMEEIRRYLDEFATILGCLCVEENSIITNTFISILKDVDQLIVARNDIQHLNRVNHKLIERDILYPIIREVLRLEVAFCCPDLPMMLTKDVFLAMGDHLRRVFDKNLNRIGLKLNRLATEASRSMRIENEGNVNADKQFLDSKIRVTWKKLDLKPQADSH
ncbi:hypothetical protein L484_015648 [Morus notabilis]|uniref:Uncharacterized protein n=1 Tax=Morus notabilis TaxID=981085 RepID=W9R8P8_9ROSA|nr:hypothetical protein L484_015648 [Morus notabilis]